MTEIEAKASARKYDLSAKSGIWFKARQSASDPANWCVVRMDGDKERVWRR